MRQAKATVHRPLSDTRNNHRHQGADTVGMPNGFAPIAGHPPMWLQNGAEIGVIGTENGHTIVYGLGGSGWRTGRILPRKPGRAPSKRERSSMWRES